MKKYLLILFIVAVVGGFARDFKVFDVVGDSISAGVNPDYTSNNGWVHMLFGYLGSYDTIQDLWPGIVKYNSSVSGSKASDWAKENYFSMTELVGHNPDLVVVFIGGNDFLIYCADGKVTDTEKNEYKKNLRTIIDKLKAIPAKPFIIVVGYYDLFDGFSENLPSFYSNYRIISQLTIEGNQIIGDVAREKGCEFVGAVYTDFMHHCYGEDLGDTNHLTPDYMDMPLLINFDIHPVTAGHEAIYRIVYEKLEELKKPALPSGWMLY